MLDTILVPIDFSGEGDLGPTLEIARNLAQGYRSKLVLLHVVARVPGYAAAQIPEGVHEKIKADARARLEGIVQNAGFSSDVESQIREGYPATEILECAREINAKLIVIKSHDPVLSDYLLGSTAARVVRHAHCSVFVVRLLDA